MKAAADDGRWEGEVAQRCKDGHLFLAHVVITAVRDDAGKVLAFAIDGATHDTLDGGTGEDYCFGNQGDAFVACEHIIKPD